MYGSELVGKHVKIDVDGIMARKGCSKKFVKFLKKNKNTIFTVVDSDIKTKITGIIYQVQFQDTGEVPIWLFYEGDLVEVEE